MSTETTHFKYPIGGGYISILCIKHCDNKSCIAEIIYYSE